MPITLPRQRKLFRFAIFLIAHFTTQHLLFSKNCSGESKRPNVVWIVVDDMSCHFGYQGEPLARTPNVDQLAKTGVIFDQAYATAPVCSTFRSAMITGMYQTTIGAHHHRSGRGELTIELPKPVVTIPELFRQHGYYTCIADATTEKYGKQDYNFSYETSELYDGIDYRNRKPGQPFFAQYQLRGGKIRNVESWYQEAKDELKDYLTDREKVTLPPYYPDHPVIREDWAQYIDSVNYTDFEVGRIIERLRKDQVLDNTIVFFLTDHGISHARGKQFLYDEGIHIPFLVWSPTYFPSATVRKDLISHIDLAATSLDVAGIEIPDWMQGRTLFDDGQQKRTHVVSARDRCDETVDRIRSVRTKDWKYIRNTYPQRPYLQPSNYKDSKPFMPILRDLYAAGQLNDVQSLQMNNTRPVEELYFLPDDPWETNNLALNPKFSKNLQALRSLLIQWENETQDKGRNPESKAMYDSDMRAATQKLRQKNPDAFKQYQINIEIMKRWAREGK